VHGSSAATCPGRGNHASSCTQVFFIVDGDISVNEAPAATLPGNRLLLGRLTRSVAVSSRSRAPKPRVTSVDHDTDVSCKR